MFCPAAVTRGLLVPALLAVALACGREAEPPAERTAAPAIPRLPGEFEPQQALILSGAQLLEHHPRVFVDIVSACHGHIDIHCLVGFAAEEDLARELLGEAGLPDDAVRLIRVEVETMWLRDYGPIFIDQGNGKLRILDARYVGTEYNPNDDRVPLQLAEHYGLPREALKLILEGGNLLSNGAGLLLNSSAMVAQNRREGFDKPQIDAILGEKLGATQRAFLRPLDREPTKHVDMYCTFASPTTLIVGAYDAEDDPQNARILDQMAEALSGLQTAAGPLEVVRIPMPRNDDGHWRTYTNVVYANGVVLVPVYDGVDPQLNEQAIETYEEILPDWEVVGIDSSTLIARGGSLHCITVTMPVADAAD